MSNIQSKRLVLEYTQGRMKGIHQILGVTGEWPDRIQGPFQVSPDAQVVEFASLIRVTTRTVFYREIMSLPTGKLNDFHPEQT